MTWTKQDAITFLIGLATTVVLVVGQTLVEFDLEAVLDNPTPTLVAFGTSLATALGRYVVTELTQRRAGGS